MSATFLVHQHSSTDTNNKVKWTRFHNKYQATKYTKVTKCNIAKSIVQVLLYSSAIEKKNCKIYWVGTKNKFQEKGKERRKNQSQPIIKKSSQEGKISPRLQVKPNSTTFRKLICGLLNIYLTYELVHSSIANTNSKIKHIIANLKDSNHHKHWMISSLQPRFFQNQWPTNQFLS